MERFNIIKIVLFTSDLDYNAIDNLIPCELQYKLGVRAPSKDSF